MTIDLLPNDLKAGYEIHEWKHAYAVLKQDFPAEFDEIVAVLRGFRLRKADVAAKGGGKSPVASALDREFYRLGWREKGFDTAIMVDGREAKSPTHKVDCFKNGVAIEVEWNNKDPFFDRDLNNFRLLFDLRAVHVGVIITRGDELQDIFDALGKGDSYGPSTTHMSKLLPRIEGGGGGGCPILVFGITKKLFVEE